jgi:predicted transcriptional regulator
MAYIVANPGVYLRELSEDLDLSMGVVQYHVWVLVKNGDVQDFRSGRYRRFFGGTMYRELAQKVISLLRQKTAGRILLLLSKEPLSHTKLAAILGVTSQALTWQMGRLRTMGIIETRSIQDHSGKSYHLIDGVSELVLAYQSSTRNGEQPATLLPAQS